MSTDKTIFATDKEALALEEVVKDQISSRKRDKIKIFEAEYPEELELIVNNYIINHPEYEVKKFETNVVEKSPQNQLGSTTMKYIGTLHLYG